MIKFSNEQIYIVTGASSGIGQKTAVLLNNLGAKVVAIARNEGRLNETKNACKFPENCFVEQKDLIENLELLPKYVKFLKEKYGKFSGMVYCAGITEISPLKVLEYENMKALFDIDYFAPILMTKGLVDKRNNVGLGTSVVLVSSLAGISSTKGMISYCGAKSALINSMKAINKEIVTTGIRINAVSPSDIETPMTMRSDIKELLENRKENYPLGLGKPEDVANTILYLLSDCSKFISGQNYVIDSGVIL